MNLKEAGMSLLLSGALATSSTPAFAENDSNKESNTNNPITEQETNQFDPPLEIMEAHLNLEETTSLRNLYETVSQNPKKHIEIIDSHEEDSNGNPITTNYKVYSMDPETDERSPLFSINIIKDNRMNLASMEMIITRRGDIFKGDVENLVDFGQINLDALATIADHCFDIPKDMKNAPWVNKINTKDKSKFLEKVFVDENLNIYRMHVDEKNMIRYSAPYKSTKYQDNILPSNLEPKQVTV